ncbi:MAG: hypothetical protein OEX77_09660 [Candidatus Bathyarchaeota archaeon]|nr:hypothetical protein [Candidatus Bathyarchaeota archaeon]MDH5733703.1 hypothetical protein [Candidatus Bathyarchaeota archaeon]
MNKNSIRTEEDVIRFLSNKTGFERKVLVATNVEETRKLVEVDFEYVTGEYNDGGKIFRKRKSNCIFVR